MQLVFKLLTDAAKILTQCDKWSWETQKDHTQARHKQDITSLDLVYIKCLAALFCEPLYVWGYWIFATMT